MTKEELKYLVDVQLFIEELESFFPEEKCFEKFNNNNLLKRAVERILEVIGEAIKNYKNINKVFEITNSKEIIGLRNIIAHAYDAVDYPKLWSIVINHIPKLKLEINTLIEKYDIYLGYKK